MSPSAQPLSMRITRAVIIIFGLTVAAAPLYAVTGYSSVRNLISELGAQNTPHNYVMVIAFVAFGSGVAFDGLRSFDRALGPFVAFGVFMAAAGLFGHKPAAADVPYVPWVHAAHSVLATCAGVSITAAFVWQAIRQSAPVRRVVAAVLAILCCVLPLAMLALPSVQGAIQRLMYSLIFAWLWFYYPRSARA